MIEFKVISTIRPDKFAEQITSLLNEKWELHGAPFVTSGGVMTHALIRNIKDVKKSSA